MVIRTPDQRLRVFVSSTLGELAAERRAVARAISALRLTPVMFEAGARPHPPRELYQAYLAQSDVFIGLYWQQYGQIAPGMQVSGLEASYRHFGTPAELTRLVRDDLAVLLSERFAAARPAAAGTASSLASSRGPRPLPVSVTSLVGRERDIDEVASLVSRPEVRLGRPRACASASACGHGRCNSRGKLSLSGKCGRHWGRTGLTRNSPRAPGSTASRPSRPSA
jgi:hypothetical protein